MSTYRRPISFGSRLYPTTPPSANVVNDVPTDLVPRVPTGVNPNAVPGDIGVGGRYAEQLNRNRQIQNLDPTLTPTEDFWVDEIVRRIRAGTGAGNSVLYYDPMRFIEISQISLNIGVTDQMVLARATQKRVYLYINNTHPTQRLFVTFGTTSTLLLGVPIEANLGWFEWIYPVPQNDVHLIANGAGTTAVLMYSELTPQQLGLSG